MPCKPAANMFGHRSSHGWCLSAHRLHQGSGADWARRSIDGLSAGSIDGLSTGSIDGLSTDDLWTRRLGACRAPIVRGSG